MKTFIITIALAATLLAAQVTPALAQDSRFFRIAGPVPTTITEVTADGTVTWTNPATNATFTVQTATALPGAANWVDWVQVPVSNAMTVHRVFDPNPPSGMALIPAGSFTMGDTLDGLSSALPLHTVYVSAFYMDKYEVTKALWDEVKAWNGGNGYSYDFAGLGKAITHPVQTVNWRDCVKWCNARSQKEGLSPCYYNEAGLTTIYKTGTNTPYAKWDANGYRLPTEAEWEKAARGGASGHRFPWSDTDNISHSRANYWGYPASSGGYAYDLAPLGSHPTFNDGVYPYTSPVGYFAANGYGLHDMAGNIWEWCWDWWDGTYYSLSPTTDPRGPSTDSYRVLRGGSWVNIAPDARCANRTYFDPVDASYNIGFRCVRGL